ncbi:MULTISPECIES: PTS sugar transporter subunit IIA [Thiorhodovibrio]|uniref:PTS sugar transporter subunit IIA n=1 Tax=Thiorhodovibrio TaxID=61593 RepID=UPI0019124896|nr:PTS sugar transporter subunit IIA [Thiorhodovibrio litoralis]MBK5967237.1 PTS fructose transporter subunit IIA [Thiorhodovibrio winogradskyi]WPL14509.1 EIIAB-Man [Thiorhodovibrio litoralis]
MTVSVLVITHNQIGAELLGTARRMFGDCPVAASAIDVTEYDDPDQLHQRATRLADELDDGSGVLILTDLFGSTPSNVANSIRRGHQVRVLAGVNLPMLVRTLNYHWLDLPAITEKALSGGREGVLLCQLDGVQDT